jgi:hypothetical protein
MYVSIYVYVDIYPRNSIVLLHQHSPSLHSQVMSPLIRIQVLMHCITGHDITAKRGLIPSRLGMSPGHERFDPRYWRHAGMDKHPMLATETEIMIAGGVDGENIGNSHPVVKTCVFQLHDCQACSIARQVNNL